MPSASPTPSAFLAIFWGGLACGVLDITQAFIAWGFMKITPVMILHHIASGVLGRKAAQGGAATAALGLMLHFVIAFSAAAIYYLASRRLTLMTEHTIVSGMLYGEAVFLFMFFVVTPVSGAGKSPFTTATLVTGPIGHMFLVGLPIALAVRRWVPLK